MAQAAIIREFGLTLYPCPLSRFPKMNEYIQSEDPLIDQKREYMLTMYGNAFEQKPIKK